MRPASLLTIALASGLSMAAPTHEKEMKEKKEKEYSIDDATILNYALTLEFLERKFYREGLANYTQADFIAAGFEDPFYENLKEVARDEETHVEFLSSALVAAGAKPVSEATYSFPSTDAKSFVTLSSVLEGVGVSAYLGAAASIMEKGYLTAAASILSVESRHSSYIRSALDQLPFPTPFDTPLDFNSVFSLAAMFITGFAPGDAALPFKAFPPLMLTCPKAVYPANGTVNFMHKNTNAPTFAAFFSGLVPTIVPVHMNGDQGMVMIPANVTGQAYVVLTKDAASATDETIIAGPAVLEVAPVEHEVSTC
ncbi:MAG: 26S proteasome regulatory subunit 6B [Watsoniomyces obsoletus]|nr:MAG: 26S proteasome regulatory subunit 6B [Watsoniomyces obsoletus]